MCDTLFSNYIYIYVCVIRFSQLNRQYNAMLSNPNLVRISYDISTVEHFVPDKVFDPLLTCLYYKWVGMPVQVANLNYGDMAVRLGNTAKFVLHTFSRHSVILVICKYVLFVLAVLAN